jgi:hypothetical protein
MKLLDTFFLLIATHYLGDFALQSDWMARTKIPGEPNWRHALIAHCMIQSLGVFLVTGRRDIALCEFWAHLIIDFAKGKKILDFNQDQACHLFCRCLWALWIAFF